jgi:hypothetical protein
MMAKDLERRGQRELTTYTVRIPSTGRELTISPLTALFLNTVWGADRLTRVMDARTGVVESLKRFNTAQIRLDNLEREMTEILVIEKIERADAYTTFQHKIARTTMEINLLPSEQSRREQENATELARLKAEAREHDQRAQPLLPPKEGTAPRKDNVDAGLNKALADARRHLHLTRELNKMRCEIDECVGAGEFAKEDGERIKDEIEQIMFAAVGKP